VWPEECRRVVEKVGSGGRWVYRRKSAEVRWCEVRVRCRWQWCVGGVVGVVSVCAVGVRQVRQVERQARGRCVGRCGGRCRRR